MRRRVPKKLGVAAVVALALGVALLVPAFTRYPLIPAVPVRDPGAWRGAYHVHTTLSDGKGTVEDVAAAAKRAGATWVVFADHNKMIEGGPRYADGVLLVPSTEVSSAEGHVVGLGMPRALTDAERRGRPLDAIRELGGAPLAAHPINRKRPYTATGDARLAGMEILSVDDLFREAMVSPTVLVPAAFAYPLNPASAAVRMIARPTKNLERWDALLRERRMAGMCSVDAHGYPPYDAIMRVIGAYAAVGAPPSGDARRDADALVAALAAGRGFCAIDAFAPAAGFRFEAVGDGAKASVGEEIALSTRPELKVRLAYEAALVDARPTLVCGGSEVALSEEAARGGERSWSFRPSQPGACRVEIGLRDGGRERPWILSNPVYVR